MSTFKPLKYCFAPSGAESRAGCDDAEWRRRTGQRKRAATENIKWTTAKPAAKRPAPAALWMLDPGHGGIDTGAIGLTVPKEKHVVLAIAKNVRSILRSNGIDARLTRTGDTFIPLYDRVEIAHQHGADLFMSIHADGFTNPSAAGASVFALSNRGASSAMAKYLSDRENRADRSRRQESDRQRSSAAAGAVRSGATDTIKNNSLTLGSHNLKKDQTSA